MTNVNPTFKFALREDLQDTNNLFLPKQAEPNATGYDVRAAQADRQDIIIKPGAYFKIPLGFRCIPEDGWWYHLHPRSSSFVKKHLHCLVGVIDQDFFLEAIWVGQYQPDVYDLQKNDMIIKFGDAVGQIIPFKRQEMIVEQVSNVELEELHSSKKVVRNGGWGSTDSNTI